MRIINLKQTKKMNKNFLDSKLSFVREFQIMYPKSHVGGSLGLFLLGVDLKRDISESDIDIISDEFRIQKDTVNSKKAKSWSDFDDVCVKESNGYLVKFEVSIKKDYDYVVVVYEGEQYNVSKFESIMKFKREYARKGVQKHIDDIVTIQSGVRPNKEYNIVDEGLPF